MPKIRLFFFPYAGASASIYERWKAWMPSSIDVVPIELPGRGRRFGEPLLTKVEDLVASTQADVVPYLDDTPYALFGHSIGSILAFEMGRRLRKMGYPEPMHLFVSGRAAPHLEEDSGMRLLSDDRFAEEIYALGGTPPQFFENPQLRAMFLPILRADYEASETYRYDPALGRLKCDLTVFSGLQDGDYDPAAWGNHTTGECFTHAFEGGHFFLHDHASHIAEKVVSRLFQQGGVVG